MRQTTEYNLACIRDNLWVILMTRFEPVKLKVEGKLIIISVEKVNKSCICSWYQLLCVLVLLALWGQKEEIDNWLTKPENTQKAVE